MKECGNIMLNDKIKEMPNVALKNVWYEFINSKNEHVVIEINETHCNPNDKKCLPNLWVKHGYINKPIYDYLTCQTYVTLQNGTCISKYNPTIKLSEDKCRMVVNFDWLLEANESNKEKILNEIYRLAEVIE